MDAVPRLKRLLERMSGVVVLESERPGHALELAARAVEEGTDRLVVAGGDGTVNEVVNGMGEARREVPLGLIPLGTANDLARSLDLPQDPEVAVALLDAGAELAIDLISVQHKGAHRLCVNVASGGLSGVIGQSISRELKAKWGAIAYLVSALHLLPDLEGYHVNVVVDGTLIQSLVAVNVFVANGRFTGGGMEVSPIADLTDGMLNFVSVKLDAAGELLRAGAEVLLGGDFRAQALVRLAVDQIEISSEPELWFNLDGERFAKTPLTFQVQPRSLRVITGPAGAV